MSAWSWNDAMKKLGIPKLDYQVQRGLFRRAKEAGWNGKEPSILGTGGAEFALKEAVTFLLANAKT